MSDEKNERSFLAVLNLKDGTCLGFSKILAGGVNVEGHDFLCANSFIKQSITVYFRPNDEGCYVMFLKAWELPGNTNVGMRQTGREAESVAPSLGQTVEKAISNNNDKLSLAGEVSPSPLEDKKTAAQAPEQGTSPSQEPPLYIGVNKGGWIYKTTNAGVAYLAQISGCNNREFSIDRTDAQEVYLKSWLSKNNMQTYKREDFPPKAWFAWMTDCDGTDAVLKLEIKERYNADGSVRK